MKFQAAALVGAVLLFGCAAPASGQTVCGDRAEIVAKLESRYQEFATAVGISENNIVELFLSESGSWTILLSFPTGTTCLIAAGEEWQAVPEKPKGVTL